MKYRGPVARRTLDVWLLLVLLSVCSGYWVYFRNLFPLFEFRDWIAYDLNAHTYMSSLFHTLGRGGGGDLFTRNVSFLSAIVVGHLCGLDIPCLNGWMLVPTVASTALLYKLARQTGLPTFAAFVAVLLWLFSLPVIGAVAWQATVHDKFVLMFSLAALVYWMARLDAGAVAGMQIVTNNLVLLLLLFLAYNSKESAWFLAPSLALALLRQAGGSTTWLRTGRSLVLPLSYAVFHNVTYLSDLRHIAAGSAWPQHVAGQAVWVNLPVHLAFLPGGVAGAALLGVLLALNGWAYLRNGRNGKTAAYADLLWLVLTFLGAFAFPLKADAQAAYYLYVPSAFFVLGFVKALHLAWSAYLDKPWQSPLEAGALVLLVALGSYDFFVDRARPYGELLRFSDNFTRAFPMLQNYAPERKSAYFVLADENRHAARAFVGGNIDSLWRFIAPRTVRQIEALAEQVEMQQYAEPVKPDRYAIVLAPDMNLLAVCKDGQALFPRHGRCPPYASSSWAIAGQ